MTSKLLERKKPKQRKRERRSNLLVKPLRQRGKERKTSSMMRSFIDNTGLEKILETMSL
jgi:hypothetical protein